MTSILISGKDKKEVAAIALLAKKIGAKVHHIDTDEIEDVLLGAAMKKAKTNKKVSKSLIMKSLQKY